jgi:hypothetical protein
VKATAPADLRALPGRSEALLNAIAAKYADALRRQACRIEAAIVPRLSRTAARPVDQRGVGQLGVNRVTLTARRLLPVYPQERTSAKRVGESVSWCQERSFKEVESELTCLALSPVATSEAIDCYDDGPTRNAPSDADCRAPATHRNPRVAHPL